MWTAVSMRWVVSGARPARSRTGSPDPAPPTRLFPYGAQRTLGTPSTDRHPVIAATRLCLTAYSDSRRTENATARPRSEPPHPTEATHNHKRGGHPCLRTMPLMT